MYIKFPAFRFANSGTRHTGSWENAGPSGTTFLPVWDPRAPRRCDTCDKGWKRHGANKQCIIKVCKPSPAEHCQTPAQGVPCEDESAKKCGPAGMGLGPADPGFIGSSSSVLEAAKKKACIPGYDFLGPPTYRCKLKQCLKPVKTGDTAPAAATAKEKKFWGQVRKNCKSPATGVGCGGGTDGPKVQKCKICGNKNGDFVSNPKNGRCVMYQCTKPPNCLIARRGKGCEKSEAKCRPPMRASPWRPFALVDGCKKPGYNIGSDHQCHELMCTLPLPAGSCKQPDSGANCDPPKPRCKVCHDDYRSMGTICDLLKCALPPNCNKIRTGKDCNPAGKGKPAPKKCKDGGCFPGFKLTAPDYQCHLRGFFFLFARLRLYADGSIHGQQWWSASIHGHGVVGLDECSDMVWVRVALRMSMRNRPSGAFAFETVA